MRRCQRGGALDRRWVPGAIDSHLKGQSSDFRAQTHYFRGEGARVRLELPEDLLDFPNHGPIVASLPQSTYKHHPQSALVCSEPSDESVALRTL